MRKYFINIHSNKIAIILLVLLFPIDIFILDSLPREINFAIRIAIFLGLLVFTGYIIFIMSRAKIKIELADECFRHKWIHKFIFSNEKDIEITWDKIIDYIIEEDRGFDSFQLTLTDNKRYKIVRYNHFPQKDDFHKFIIQFPKFINKETNTKIKIGISFFETRVFKWLMIFFTFCLLFMIYEKITKPDSSTNWGTLGLLASSIVFYWTRMKILKNKNNRC